MNADPEVEKIQRAVPGRKSRFRIKSLMAWVALIAVGLAWVLHVARTDRAFQADRARFIVWAAEFEKDHPMLKPLKRSMTATGLVFWIDHRWNQDYQTPTGERVSIQTELQVMPFWSKRLVTFKSAGRVVTWPIEDIERGRKIDLKAEFPEAFR